MAGTGKRSGVLHVQKVKAGGWTKQARAQFLLHLAATCNVKASLEAVGRSRGGLYELRARDPAFAQEWALALEQGYQQLEAELLRTAMGGASDETLAAMREVEAGGVMAEPVRPFEPELALRLLKQRQTVDPQGRRQRTRLKQPSPQEVLKALDRKLTAMEKRLGRRP